MTDTRLRSARLWSRVLAVLAVVAAVGAGVAWWTVAHSPDVGAVVIDVEDTVAGTTPVTLPPRVEQENPGGTVARTADTAPPTTDARSPLADLLGPVGSAIPEPLRPIPVRLVVDDINVHHPVRAVGLDDDGSLEIPDETEVGWWKYGSAPGQPGVTVLAAHLTWNRQLGPFYRVGELDLGDRIDVVMDDGTTRVYEMVERTIFDKDELPFDRIWRTDGPETLALVTCGGSYNPEIRRYRQNIVVFAVPVDQFEGAPAGSR